MERTVVLPLQQHRHHGDRCLRPTASGGDRVLDRHPRGACPARDGECTLSAASSWPAKQLGRILRFMTFFRLPPPGSEVQHQPARQLWSTMGNFAPDGKTYYAHPELSRHRRLRVHRGPHRPVQSADAPALAIPGRWQAPRSYGFLRTGRGCTRGKPAYSAGNSGSVGPDGLVIEDVSDYQFRRPNPQIRIISTLFWDDQGQRSR